MTDAITEVVQRVVQELPIGIWVARASDGSEVFANERFREILGTGLLDVAAGGYAEPYGIYDRSGALLPNERMPFMRALAARGPVEQDDIVIHRRDGARVFIRATAKPLFGPDGEPEFVVVAFNDITREVVAQAAREESEQRERRATHLEAIGKLAGGIAHDFNNLLAVISNAAHLVRAEKDEQRRADDVALILDVTNRAAALVRSLLDFAGRRKTQPQPLSLSALIEGVAAIFRRTLPARIELVVELESKRVVDGDALALEQVVMNLIFNACEAMPAGGTLTLRTLDDGERAVLEVEDTGQGIPEALRARIFEPYVTSKHDSGAGGGLGLATAYGIVRAHDGSIDVDSALGRGTRVRVSLPSSPATAATAATMAAATAGATTTTPVPAGGRGRVLLVEDVGPVRMLTERVLVHLGFDVVSAADGVEAVAIFEREHRALSAMLLDIRMPRLDGKATLRRLRAIDATVPAIFLTGGGVDEADEVIAETGADGFLTKPIDVDRLAHELLRVCRR